MKDCLDDAEKAYEQAQKGFETSPEPDLERAEVVKRSLNNLRKSRQDRQDDGKGRTS